MGLVVGIPSGGVTTISSPFCGVLRTLGFVVWSEAEKRGIAVDVEELFAWLMGQVC